jgi:hypothetical protein
MRTSRATCEETDRVDIRDLARQGLVSGDTHQLFFEDVLSPVSVTRTSCHFGGSRPWFSCPQCRERVAVLFRGTGGLRCRECSGLYYETQRASGSMKTLLRLRRMRAKLGATSLSVLDPFPPKPKGLRWLSYLKRWRLYQAAEQRHCKFLLENSPILR